MIEAKKAAKISYDNNAEKMLSKEIEGLILKNANGGETMAYYKVPPNYNPSQITHFLIKYGYTVSQHDLRTLKICWGAALCL